MKKISSNSRAGLREVTNKLVSPTKSDRISSIFSLASHSGPTDDIETILEEIQKGRNIPGNCSIIAGNSFL